MWRREISGRSLARALLAHPFMTAQVMAAIYWQVGWWQIWEVSMIPATELISVGILSLIVLGLMRWLGRRKTANVLT